MSQIIKKKYGVGSFDYFFSFQNSSLTPFIIDMQIIIKLSVVNAVKKYVFCFIQINESFDAQESCINLRKDFDVPN